MPYLGNTPAANFATVTKDTFSGNASTTAFTLSKTATTNGVAVYVENVRQIPTTAYAVSGTTLTFTGAPPSGTNNIYVMHHNTPVSTATHPAAQNLTAVDGTFTGNIDVDGTANLDVVDIDGAVDMASTLGVTGNVTLGGTLDMNGAELILDADADSSITADTDDEINFKTGGTDRMTIDANGNVGVGVDPEDHLHVKGFFQVEGKAGDGNYIRFDNSANSGNIWRIGPGVYSHTTFSIYNQTDNSQVVNIESVSDQLMFRSMTVVNLADDATAVAVANSFQGLVVVTSSSNALTGIYRCEGQNTPTLISGNSLFTNSDTDGKFCLISAASSSNVTFRNRYGATYGFKIASFGVLS
jgi:hypothetical protein